MAEQSNWQQTTDLKSVQCGFEFHLRYHNAEHTFMCRGRKKRKRSLGPFLSRRLLWSKTRPSSIIFLVLRYLQQMSAELRVSVKESAVALSDLTLAHSHQACVGHRKVSTVLKPKADYTAPGGGTQMFHQKYQRNFGLRQMQPPQENRTRGMTLE